MRGILSIIFLFLIPLMSSASSSKEGVVEVVVHRGANALAPENTIASADSALAHGANWIEVDVRRSKDGVLFNLHDETLDRTTNGKGKLSDMKSSKVRKLDAGAWFSSKFIGMSIPTIAEMLAHLQGKAKVFFDVKRGTPVEDLVKLVRKKGYADKSFFWFADEQMLRQFVQIASDMKVKVNASNIPRLEYWLKICTPAYVEIAPQNITPSFMEYCHSRGILVMAACQEDDISQFQLVLDKKADLVNLDRPEVFEKLLK
jgi:glycerophosphoryl diester phosphodiesterase